MRRMSNWLDCLLALLFIVIFGLVSLSGYGVFLSAGRLGRDQIAQ